jgi:hypothetical protein
MSAGGFMAWVDVGLLLEDRMFGGAVRAETARFVLSDPAAREARYFAGFAPMQAHGDTAVLKAQEEPFRSPYRLTSAPRLHPPTRAGSFACTSLRQARGGIPDGESGKSRPRARVGAE